MPSSNTSEKGLNITLDADDSLLVLGCEIELQRLEQLNVAKAQP